MTVQLIASFTKEKSVVHFLPQEANLPKEIAELFLSPNKLLNLQKRTTMLIQQHTIYADPAMTGAALRRELKAKKIATTWLSREVKPVPKHKMAQTELEMYFKEAAERQGIAVDYVTTTSRGIVIRERF